MAAGAEEGSLNPQDQTAYNTGPYRAVLAIWRKSLTASTTLAALKTTALSANIKAIVIVPDDATDTIRVNAGAAASNATARWPVSGMALPGDKTLLDTIYLYAASSSEVSFFELG